MKMKCLILCLTTKLRWYCQSIITKTRTSGSSTEAPVSVRVYVTLILPSKADFGLLSKRLLAVRPFQRASRVCDSCNAKLEFVDGPLFSKELGRIGRRLFWRIQGAASPSFQPSRTPSRAVSACVSRSLVCLLLLGSRLWKVKLMSVLLKQTTQSSTSATWCVTRMKSRLKPTKPGSASGFFFARAMLRYAVNPTRQCMHCTTFYNAGKAFRFQKWCSKGGFASALRRLARVLRWDLSLHSVQKASHSFSCGPTRSSGAAFQTNSCHVSSQNSMPGRRMVSSSFFKRKHCSSSLFLS